MRPPAEVAKQMTHNSAHSETISYKANLFSRRLLGYVMGERHDAELVVVADHMAVATRGDGVKGATFRSDRGSAYTSAASARSAAHSA